MPIAIKMAKMNALYFHTIQLTLIEATFVYQVDRKIQRRLKKR